MNRIMKRAKVLLALVLVLAIGMAFFTGEYFINSGNWVLFPGSPHVYNAGNLGCGLVTDRDGILLMDLTGSRIYSQNLQLRMSTLHWLGDRQGNISAPALASFSKQIAGYDPINGIFSYGGTGGQVDLTLSAQLQMIALEALGDMKGTVAVYNYKTGEILCAVTNPTYDPDNMPDILGDTTGAFDGAFVNRFTQSSYTPGSIFKIVTAAAALEYMPEVRSKTFTCNGILEYGIDKVTCETAHGTLSFDEAFARSCNCAFAQIAESMGGRVLERYAQQFKVLDSVTFDGITTAKGNIEAANQADVSVAWSGIGQHKNLINPCRYMTFLGSIAAGGVDVTPHLIEKITVGYKTTYQASPEYGERIMSEETARIMQQLLRNNVQNYYGDDLFPGLSVCAKSGTAEVGEGKKPHAWFAGFLKNEDAPYAFVVLVENGGSGAAVAGNVAGRVLDTIVNGY